MGVILNIPGGKYTIGDESSWVGFFGNYSGGIIGGIVAYLIATQQMKKEQQARMEDEREQIQKGEIEKKKTEKYINGLISIFLKEEIQENLATINKEESYLQGLQYRTDNERVAHHKFSPPLNFSEFTHVKYELLKHDTTEVRRVFQLYSIFNLLVTESNSNNFKSEKAIEILEILDEFRNKDYHWE